MNQDINLIILVHCNTVILEFNSIHTFFIGLRILKHMRTQTLNRIPIGMVLGLTQNQCVLGYALKKNEVRI